MISYTTTEPTDTLNVESDGPSSGETENVVTESTADDLNVYDSANDSTDESEVTTTEAVNAVVENAVNDAYVQTLANSESELYLLLSQHLSIVYT